MSEGWVGEVPSRSRFARRDAEEASATQSVGLFFELEADDLAGGGGEKLPGIVRLGVRRR